MPFVELHAGSAFSFLRGASQPSDMVRRAAELGLAGLALCERNGLYSAPRLHAEARTQGLKPITGAELTLVDGFVLPVLVANRTGYRNLSRLVTTIKLRHGKEGGPVGWKELEEASDGLVALTGSREEGALSDPEKAPARMRELVRIFGKSRLFAEVSRHLQRGEECWQRRVRDAATALGLLPVATNHPLVATREGRTALDLFTCIRHHTPLRLAGRLLAPNAEHHIKPAERMLRLFADDPTPVENTRRVAERLEFTLADLGYAFPTFDVPDGETMETFLHRQTYEGARSRYGGEPDARVRAQLEKELSLITRLGFCGYFLIVWDLVRYCRSQGILVQGRGSAANSAVCYCLGITACDPVACHLLFERFLSEGRKSWPDIDLDLPSGERRERVIQEVYRRYGRHGAAMTANVITFRGRSAMREIGKALEFPEESLQRFSSLFANGDFPHTLGLESQLARSGITRSHPQARAALSLYRQIHGLPRHLGQHSGGMIICRNDLGGIVPLEPASMAGRVVAQWDKDDCEDLGIIKVDLLGLGMLAAMQDTLELCRQRGHPVELATIPKDDPATYALLQKADTIGTFQVESRAQMATLPRLKPRCFYDLVVEVAIIRPGPIQGQMVHPYLARRQGLEAVTYFDPRLEQVLERTLGVPIFQEQLLKMAMVMADFSGSEAEELRRALSFHRSQERMEKVCVKLHDGMAAKGVPPETRAAIVRAVQSFAVYGFPESHAISFALIAYASCWLKVHRAAEFYCGLLNNQPMGFYSAATLVRDAKAHGVGVRPVSVIHSEDLCSIGEDGALRLGLNRVRGLERSDRERILAARARRAFDSLDDFRERAALGKSQLRMLARIGALNGLVAHRREGLWNVECDASTGELPLFAQEAAPLVPMQPAERLSADYAGTGLTTGPHPMSLLRCDLHDIVPAGALDEYNDGDTVEVAGMVICRQRPGTGKGVVFVSLEDETGISNAIVSPALFERLRLVITGEPFLKIRGRLQKREGTIHIQARSIQALDRGLLTRATPDSHDFH